MKISENFSEAGVLCALLTLITVIFSITPIHNGNFFWHLRNGIDIVESGQIRTEDPFTWTRQGVYWIQHEWLAESAMALSWIHLGESGPVLLKAFFIGLSVFFAFRASIRNGADPGFAFIVAVFWLSLAQPRWITRPHFFSIFFFSVYLYILSFKLEKPWKLALILFPIQILWVNVHAGFVMGFFLASVPAMGKLLKREYKDFWKWTLPPVTLLLASGIHPNGFRTLEYLPSFLAQPLFKQSIREWWSPFDPRYAPDRLISRTAFILSSLCIGTLALLVKFRNRTMDRGKLLALLLLLTATIFAARNGELLAPAIVAWVPGMLKLKIPAKFCTIPFLILLVIPFVYGVPREIGPPKQLGTGVDWSVYPVELSDLLEEHPALLEKAVLFNMNEIAGYIEFRFGERLPLFVDGRCLLFPESFFWDYLILAEAPGNEFISVQKNIFDDFGFNLLIYNTRDQFSSVYLAAALPEWVPIHMDGLTSTYAKWDLLHNTHLEDLAFRYFDPLDPVKFLTTPLYLQPISSLEELSTQREQLSTSILNTVIESFYFRSDTLYSPSLSGEDGTIWSFTLDCWINCRDGDLQSAATSAALSGDRSLQTAVSYLETGILLENETMMGINSNLIISEWSEKAAYISALWITGQQQKALNQTAIHIDSLPPWGVAQCAWLYSLSGEQERAEELAGIALFRRQGPVVLKRTAQVYRTAGDYTNSLEYAKRALVVSPGFVEARLILADNLWDLNRIEEAVTEYKWFGENDYSLPQYANERLLLIRQLGNRNTPIGGEGL